MTDTYEKLLALQNLLTEKFKLEEKKDELPKMLSSKNEVLNRLKKSYLSKHSHFKHLEESIFDHQRLMSEITLHKQKLDERVKVISTQKEYESLDKEIAMASEKEEQYKFQLLQDKRVIDDLKQALERDEEMIKHQENDIKNEDSRINGELDRINDSLTKLIEKENELVKGIDDNTRYKFERIVKNKDGIGIVTVTKGHCNGCHVILPAEFINRIRMNEEIQFCPYCSRILYYEGNAADIFSMDDEFDEDDDDYFGSDD